MFAGAVVVEVAITNSYCSLSPPTFQEGFHGSAVGHVDGCPARVGGEGGVGAASQQESHNLQVVVLHGVVQRPESQEEKKLFAVAKNKQYCE